MKILLAPIENDTAELLPGQEVLDEPVLKDIQGDGTGEDAPIEETVEETPEVEETTPTDKKAVSISDFAEEMGIETPKPSAKAKVEAKESVETTTLAQQQRQDIFDYTGYTPNEQQLLKRMALPARQWAASMVKERRELNGKVGELTKTVTQLQGGKPQIPASFYEHPEAYRLTPEFANLQQDATTAQQIYNHWRQQVINAESGEDWVDLDVDAKGKLITGAKKEVTAADKLLLREHLEHAREQLSGIQQKASAMAQEHKTSVSNKQTQITQQEDKYFPQFKDEKFVGWPLARGVEEDLKKAGFDGNPLLGILSKSAAANTLLIQEVQRLRKLSDGKQKLASDRQAAGPGASKTAAPGKGGNGKPEVTFDDFKAAMAGD